VAPRLCPPPLPSVPLVGLTLALIACPKPGASTPDAAVAERAEPVQADQEPIQFADLEVVPLGGLDAPYDPENPPLSGDRTALDLKSLVRSKLDYDITMDTSSLAELDEDGASALLLHLAADPRWRVFEDRDVVLAARRVKLEQGWTVPASGYHPGPEGPWRVVLRFGSLSDDHPWKASPYVAEVPAEAGHAKVEGFVPEASVYEGRVITALRIEGPQVALDIYETGDEDGRPRTGDALGEVPPTVANAVMLADRLRENGHEPLLLPPGEPGPPGTELSLSTPRPGELSWSVRVNPGESGWVWLRLLHDGEAWEDVAVNGGTRERVGYSKDPKRTFLAQGRFSVPSGQAFQGTAEVWFLPDRGDARRLHSAQVQVPAR